MTPSPLTAAFNSNILLRVNRELGSDFQIDQFEHRAQYNDDAGRIEMHLVSLIDQIVTLNGVEISFAQGESIWTESSYKYTIPEFVEMAERSGFEHQSVWTDEDTLFSVHYLSTVSAQ